MYLGGTVWKITIILSYCLKKKKQKNEGIYRHRGKAKEEVN